MKKEEILNWLALVILFTFAAIIVIPSAAFPNFFMGVAAPVLLVMTVFYAVLWAGRRAAKFMKEEQKKGDKNENTDNRSSDAYDGLSAGHRR